MTTVNGIRESYSSYFDALKNTAYTAAGSNAENIVITGNGNDIVTVDGDSAVVLTGEGNDTVDVTGKNAVIDAGNGNNNVSVKGDNAVVLAGNGNDNVNVVSNNATLITGNGKNDINVVGNNALIVAGSGDDEVSYVGNGSMIELGDGNNDMNFWGSNNSIEGGNGNNTILSDDKLKPAGATATTTKSKYTTDQYTTTTSSSVSAGGTRTTTTTTNNVTDKNLVTETRATGCDNNNIFTGSGNDTIIIKGESQVINAGGGSNNVEIKETDLISSTTQLISRTSSIADQKVSTSLNSVAIVGAYSYHSGNIGNALSIYGNDKDDSGNDAVLQNLSNLVSDSTKSFVKDGGNALIIDTTTGEVLAQMSYSDINKYSSGIGATTSHGGANEGSGGTITIGDKTYNVAASALDHSPLTFDLNGDGVKTSNDIVTYDIDGNGEAVQINDVADGLLCIRGGDDGNELFGNNTDLDGDGNADGYANGFEALKALAAKEGLINGTTDMMLDENDIKALEEKYQFGMKTGGYNSKSQSLESLGITEINLASTQSVTTTSNFDGQDNTIMEQDGATFIINGEKREYADIWNSLK